MAAPSDGASVAAGLEIDSVDSAPASGHRLEQITEVLVRLAGGDFSARATRSYQGDPWDVLAYMVNATAEEVAFVIAQLREERRQLGEIRSQLIQAEKLAALGELAGGVAHELNQPLTAIQMLTELMLEHTEETIGSRRTDLELIQKASLRMGRIVSAVRTFGRGIQLDMRELSPRRPVDEALRLLAEPLRAAHIAVTVEEQPTLSRVVGNAESLQQVFINLLSNARDALSVLDEDNPREIEIALSEAAELVCIAITDSGPGIPEDIAPRIFDPFFSTKAVGHGSGLGLSISHGIIAEHGGTLRYEPTASGGARFVVELPAANEPPAPRGDRP